MKKTENTTLWAQFQNIMVYFNGWYLFYNAVFRDTCNMDMS